MSQLPLVLITDLIVEPLDCERSVLDGHAEVRALDARSQAELDARIEDAEALMIYHYLRLDRATIGRLRKCRLIARPGVGYDNIDVDGSGTITVGGITIDPSANGGTVSFGSGRIVHAGSGYLGMYDGDNFVVFNDGGVTVYAEGRSLRISSLGIRFAGLPTTPLSSAPSGAFVGAVISDGETAFRKSAVNRRISPTPTANRTASSTGKAGTGTPSCAGTEPDSRPSGRIAATVASATRGTSPPNTQRQPAPAATSPRGWSAASSAPAPTSSCARTSRSASGSGSWSSVWGPAASPGISVSSMSPTASYSQPR